MQKSILGLSLSLFFFSNALLRADTPGKPVLWNVDNQKSIGGHQVTVVGKPRVIETNQGKAIEFDGRGDGLFVAANPLADLKEFTVEVIFRPEGGKFEQRFMHIAETDPETGQNVKLVGRGDRNPRLMFEVRVTDAGWYLDTFV